MICEMCKKNQTYDPNVRYCIGCEQIIFDARVEKTKCENNENYEKWESIGLEEEND